MPPEIHSYAVFGFSENLDWSTLHFVKPIDDIRVCSACRVVARKAAFLPCRHVLREPCYEQWKPRVKVCFLDGDLCPESEVHWRVFPVERMMKSEVSCWNRANGCETITDVSRIADHFHRDCEYHTTCCPECSSTVLRRDIIAHLESHCVKHVLNRESSTPPREGVFKEVEDIREGLRCLEWTFRNASPNTACLLSSPPSITANDEANLQPLLKMEVEVKQISQMMEQASSAMEERSQTRLDQIAALKAFGACLSAELDEMKRAAVEWASCETTAAHCVRTEREEHVENLQLLQRDLRSVSSKLEQLNRY
ncbi:uncharacterized protein LOC119377519 [Rhipicephalus sanguineus]|uniref:uncharacterized protein LOC119376259 n=1 Tax=Rhipicephalus sanguineus TaxID=34632 RepID=UPI001894E942|nr:uncharacterized protein LOC119376259 [Rhipicephalus sanguineus]XP_037502882.1 uncharacterized protein LOC119377519 [Rhipicephalus sanguineus]